MRNQKQTNYEEQLKPLLETKENYIKEGKKAMRQVFSKFFEENPDTLYVFWQQYTPYFNDGEQCEFGVHDFYSVALNEDAQLPRDKEGNKILPTLEYVLENIGYDSIEFEAMEEELSNSVTPCTVEEYSKFFTSSYENDLGNAMRSISDILEGVIGDHVKVLVDRNLEIHTLECEHE